jgi:hypothetical protein
MADFIGYMYMDDRNRRAIDFNPAYDHWGKNSADLPILEVPQYEKGSLYFAEVIEEMKASLGNMSKNHQEALEAVKDVARQLEGVQTAPQLNELLSTMGEVKNGKKAVWAKMQSRAKELGIQWDAKKKLFYTEEF